eukprot:1469844-Prymnesium_polylepis.1
MRDAYYTRKTWTPRYVPRGAPWDDFSPYAPPHTTAVHASPIDYLHRPLLPPPRNKKRAGASGGGSATGPYAGNVFQVTGERSNLNVGPLPLSHVSVVVGLINGNEARRRLLGCTWMKLPRPPTMRGVWVLCNATMPTRWYQPEAATLLVRCSERMYMHTTRKGKKPAVFTGTFTMYYKVIEFVLLAATQPEDIAVRVDDDAFVSPMCDDARDVRRPGAAARARGEGVRRRLRMELVT